MRTLDPSFCASNAGAIPMDPALAARMAPDLFGEQRPRPPSRQWWRNRFWTARVPQQLELGDGRAAMVLSTDPLRIACYADDFDAAVVLGFPQWVHDLFELEAGTRLLTCNVFFSDGDPAWDVVSGPAPANESYVNFAPLVADFLSRDTVGLEQRRAHIGEAEWSRCWQAGQQYLVRTGGACRDGHPRLTGVPASRGRVPTSPGRAPR